MNKKIVILPICIVLILLIGWVYLSKGEIENSATIEVITENGETQVISLESIPIETFEGVMLHKVEDPVERVFQGIPLKYFLTEICGIEIYDDSVINVYAEDTYRVQFNSDEILMDNNIYLVLVADGEELKNIDGDTNAPMIVVLNDNNSERWIKYIETIEIKS